MVAKASRPSLASASQRRSFGIPCVTVAVILCLQLVPTLGYASSEDGLYLYRLKKLRNNFLSQVDEQVASHDALVERTIDEAAIGIVHQISKATWDTATEIETLLSEGFWSSVHVECVEEQIRPQSRLTSRADLFLQECVQEVTASAEEITKSVDEKVQPFLGKTCELSLWFLSTYLSDCEGIYTEGHYNDVYNRLAAQVVDWDNVGSMDLFRSRQDVVQRLEHLSNDVFECTQRLSDVIAAEVQVMVAEAKDTCG